MDNGLFGSRLARHFGFQPGAALTVRGSDGGVKTAVTHLACEHVGADATRPTPPEAAFSIMVQLEPLAWHELRFGAKHGFEGEVPAGAVSVVNLEDGPRSRMKGRFVAVQFYVPRRTFEDLARESGGQRLGRLTHPRAQRDPTALALASLLLPHLRGEAPTSSLYAEHVSTAFLAHAVSRYGGLNCTSPRSRGGLSPWQQRRSLEMLRAALAQPVTIADLARECRLSSQHFAASFRATNGVPPYRYLNRLRIEEAKRLLISSALPLAEVAVQCGFGNQSHLTHAFTQATGVSPGAWRRACAH